MENRPKLNSAWVNHGDFGIIKLIKHHFFQRSMMFHDVPWCSMMFHDVPCLSFYRALRINGCQFDWYHMVSLVSHQDQAITARSECSAPLLLKVSEPARLAAVTLVEARAREFFLGKWCEVMQVMEGSQEYYGASDIRWILMNFDICLCSKGFESWPSFTIWSIGYPTGLDHWTPRLTARHLWSWSTSKRVTWVPSMVATSSTTSWGQGMTWWIIWIYLDWFIYIYNNIYIYILFF